MYHVFISYVLSFVSYVSLFLYFAFNNIIIYSIMSIYFSVTIMMV